MVTFIKVEMIEASQRKHLQEETSDWRLDPRMESQRICHELIQPRKSSDRKIIAGLSMILLVVKKLRGEFDVMRNKERAREEECERLQVKCEATMTEMMLESQKWAGYQQSLSTLESKVTSLEAEKARIVSSAILYGRCRAYEQVADMKEPFDLSKVKGYRSSYKKDHTQASNDFSIATFPGLDEFVAYPLAPIEVLLSKKPPFLQRHVPSRTQVLLRTS
uniref:Uncharacterized protein n=1 Tax=Tanacetum cinerariifolium TaxID=118510 RepID=A0A699JQ26_TANCI|nr:hypothetical protein [Tanacetum cinerariifolium]